MKPGSLTISTGFISTMKYILSILLLASITTSTPTSLSTSTPIRTSTNTSTSTSTSTSSSTSTSTTTSTASTSTTIDIKNDTLSTKASNSDKNSKSVDTITCRNLGQTFSLKDKTFEEFSNPQNGAKEKIKASYGSWKSPINSFLAAAENNRFSAPPQVDPVTGNVFWLENMHGGRKNTIFHYEPDRDIVIEWVNEVDVRSLVHEYGGNPFVVYNNTIYFSSYELLAIYKQTGPNEPIHQLTNQTHRRYADGSFSPDFNSIFWVVEEHTAVLNGDKSEPTNMIVRMDVDTGEEEVITTKATFFAAPKVSYDSKRITWIQWDHPNMPWDDARLIVVRIENTTDNLILEKYLQHGSMMMPKWSVNNELFYVHDASDWWNLYILNKNGEEINLTPFPVEVGWPMWWIGGQAYDVHPQIGFKEAVVIVGKELFLINTRNGKRSKIEIDYDSFLHGITYSKDGNKAYTIAGSSFRRPELIEIDLRNNSNVRIISESFNKINDSLIATGCHIEFPTSDDDAAYGHLYMPKNPDYEANSENETPPLLIKIHGGPTTSALTFLNPTYQFFTSRGYAILDIDYRGSAGYGKYYRRKLFGKWGIYDVDDAIAGAEYLIKLGLVDENRVLISGESAGAFTSILALAKSEVFKAGASYFGISDLKKLAEKTHKFESRYIDRLVGKLPESEKLYEERSPINNLDKINSSILFISGLRDPVVPAQQSFHMHKVILDKGLPTAHISYADEGHGFLHNRNLRLSLEAEIVFYSKIFGMETDVTSELVIDNLKEPKPKPVTKVFIIQ